MKTKKILPCLLLLFPVFAGASPLFSPTWGFRLDLPEGFEFTAGDGKEKFSFRGPEGSSFDLIVYPASASNRGSSYTSAEEAAKDVQRRLGSRGDISLFEYRHKKSALIELAFSPPGAPPRQAGAMAGWGLCIELGPPPGPAALPAPAASPSPAAPPAPAAGKKPLLLALAYGPEGKRGLHSLFLSALDSIAPGEGDRRAPGPITEFSYPREKRRVMPLAAFADLEAWFYEEDAEAAQALVDREFAVLKRSAGAPRWQEAWKRFYRAVYRDSYDRLADAAFAVERRLNVPPGKNRDLAEGALRWVQSFTYERDLMGSDFVNLISAALEGRGDCDSRAMLWAVLLNHADIPAALMVSREYSHAMGLADLEGPGARLPMKDGDGAEKKWLVAETTAAVALGLIGENVSEIDNWLGIDFD
jgi:hypothetical protein